MRENVLVQFSSDVEERDMAADFTDAEVTSDEPGGLEQFDLGRLCCFVNSVNLYSGVGSGDDTCMLQAR